MKVLYILSSNTAPESKQKYYTKCWTIPLTIINLSVAFLSPFPPVLDLDALLAAGDWRPLSVVSASCTLEYLVPSALLHAALRLLGHHLQHPHDL